jgi:hypothetical protein
MTGRRWTKSKKERMGKMRKAIPVLEIVKTEKKKELALARLKGYAEESRKEKKDYDDKN